MQIKLFYAYLPHVCTLYTTLMSAPLIMLRNLYLYFTNTPIAVIDRSTSNRISLDELIPIDFSHRPSLLSRRSNPSSTKRLLGALMAQSAVDDRCHATLYGRRPLASLQVPLWRQTTAISHISSRLLCLHASISCSAVDVPVIDCSPS